MDSLLESEAKKARLDELIASTIAVAESGGEGGSVSPSYFTCGQCQKIFWSESSLKHHSSLYHSEKAFVCEICGKAFRFRSNLAEHRSVHTSVKPYVCKFCGKSSRLKGNLTKHILKHHKKEQNAYIGKDDIIIRKGKKSIKDPVAVDFLEKSMIVLPTDAGNSLPSAALHLYTMAQMVGNDVATGQDRRQPKSEYSFPSGNDMDNERESSSSDVHGGFSAADGTEPSSPDLDHDMDVLPVEASLNGLLDKSETADDQEVQNTEDDMTAPVTPRGNGSNNATRCTVCMKHFRKPGGLQLHMTLKHGYPPANESQSSNGNGLSPVTSPQQLRNGNHRMLVSPRNPNQSLIRSSQPGAGRATPPPLKVGNHFALANGHQQPHTNGNGSSSPGTPTQSDSGVSGLETNGAGFSTPSLLSSDLRELKEVLREIRAYSSNPSEESGGINRLESVLLTLDGRVGRLEKQVESSLTSLYSLVQLQSTMNSAFTRFKDDISAQLRSLQTLLLQNAAPTGSSDHS